MESSGEEEGREAGSVQDEEDLTLQDGGDEAEEDSGATVLPAAEGASQHESTPQPDDPAPQPDPDPDLSIVGEYSPVARDSVQENVAQLPLTPLLSNTPDDMEDQEPLPGDEEEEEDDEFVVLDPEHPLIGRQQAALSSQLSKQLERCNLGLKDKLATVKIDASHAEDAGVEVFRIQEQLARLQKRLDDHHQTKGQAEAKHRQAQDELEATESQFSNTISQDSEDKANVSQLQAELDNVMQHLAFLQGVSEDMRSKVKAMNNARRKAGAEKTQAEEEKLKKDLYVERLTKVMERLTQQIAMYEAQATVQAEETQAAHDAFSEAEMEMESLLMAHKQLLQQWHSTLLGLRRRADAFNAMQEAICVIEHEVILLDRETEGYKKSIIAEQEHNETLTMRLKWSQMNGATSKKLISQKQAQQKALQAHYSACVRTLRETERTLTTLTKETSTHQTELNNQRRQMDKQSSVRLELEEKIMTSMQQTLTHNKAAKYSQQLTGKIATLKNEKMCQLQQVENEVLAVRLESQQVDHRVDSLALTQKALDEEIAKLNKLLNFSQSKTSSFVRVIGQKQTVIANMNCSIGRIMASTGHDDLGPMQIKVQTLMAQIEQLAANIKSDQQLWMKWQGTLMGLTQELQANSREMLKLQTSYTAMQQMKIRLDGQIELVHREEAELEKNGKILNQDMLKLKTLLNKNGQLSEALEQDNALMEADFLHRLKETEWESIDMQMKHEATQEEKERLLNSLVEAERQIMLWEKKTLLVKETLSAVNSEVGQGEIQIMKAEIHRMEVRLNQLMKQQEVLLRESEATVARRETIVLRRETIVHSSRRQTTKGELKLMIQGLQRQIQETHKLVGESKQVIGELQNSQVCRSDNLVQRKQQLVGVCSTNYILDSDFVDLQETIDRNLAHLVTLQSRTKKLQRVCGGSYQASSTSEWVEAILQSEMERMHAVSTILHHVGEEFPQHQGAIRRLSLAPVELTQVLEQEVS